MEESVKERLIAAAKKTRRSPTWDLGIHTEGVRLRLTWAGEHDLMYKVDRFVTWAAIQNRLVNPLLVEMDDMLKMRPEGA